MLRTLQHAINLGSSARPNCTVHKALSCLVMCTAVRASAGVVGRVPSEVSVIMVPGKLFEHDTMLIYAAERKLLYSSRSRCIGSQMWENPGVR